MHCHIKPPFIVQTKYLPIQVEYHPSYHISFSYDVISLHSTKLIIVIDISKNHLKVVKNQQINSSIITNSDKRHTFICWNSHSIIRVDYLYFSSAVCRCNFGNNLLRERSFYKNNILWYRKRLEMIVCNSLLHAWST